MPEGYYFDLEELSMYEKDASLMPPRIVENPGQEYDLPDRPFQGIPGIERTRQGRLYATFYSGGPDEGPENFVVVFRSDDDGVSWSGPIVAVDHPHQLVRAFDPVLWRDPLDRLWLCWAQSYDKFDGRCGVWCSICQDPDADEPEWNEPRRIANGIMMNKPTVLRDGTWLFPAAIWADHVFPSDLNSIPEEKYSNVYVSLDEGKTFSRLGGADVRNRWFDEHMIVEKKDGRLWMLVRTQNGVGQSFSEDGGRTWSPGTDTGWGGPNSRFFIRRLASGNLLLVNHAVSTSRTDLTAFLSLDDGLSWPYSLLLDERASVSYPDGVEDEDGNIYIIYDRERYGAKEILLAKFTEKDIMSGEVVAPQSRLKQLVHTASRKG